jgi:MIP family channel proteins
MKSATPQPKGDTVNKKFRPMLAELVGTFIFVFIGAGSIITDAYTRGSLGLLGIAIAHGLMLSIMVSAFMAVSGGQFNPAVSVGLWVAKKQDTESMIALIISQLVGATLAGFVLRSLFSPELWMPVHLGTPAIAVGINPLTAFGIEAMLTFILMTAVLGTAVDSRAPKIGGFGIGLAVTAAILVGGPLTGASMNPARSFGPALAAGFWEFHWLYWIGPVVGASAAAWLYNRFISTSA